MTLKGISLLKQAMRPPLHIQVPSLWGVLRWESLIQVRESDEQSWWWLLSARGFPCGSPGKESTCNVEDLDPWVGKNPRRRERLPTPVFWPEFRGLYSPWGHKESATTEQPSLSTREGNSLQSSDQGKKRKGTGAPPNQFMFLFLPFIMTNMLEGFLFAQHFTSISVINPSNILWGGYCEQPQLTCGKREVQPGEITTRGPGKYVGSGIYLHMLCLLHSLCWECGTYKNRESQELDIFQDKMSLTELKMGWNPAWIRTFHFLSFTLMITWYFCSLSFIFFTWVF